MYEATHQNDLKRLITALRTKYAAQFNKNFPSEGKNAVPMQVVEDEAARNLVGVTPMQFERGLALFYTSINRFMPSFADFRAMCTGEDWWNTQKAWIKACEYTKIIKPKPVELPDGTLQYRDITTLAKFALDQVMIFINDGEMYRAKDEFVRLYEAYIMEAQIKGRKQEWYQEKPSLTWNEEEKKHVPVDNEIAKQQLENLKKKLHAKNRNVAQPQKLKAPVKSKSVESTWPDPFDNPQGYLQTCAVDGIDVDPKIQRQFGGVA